MTRRYDNSLRKMRSLALAWERQKAREDRKSRAGCPRSEIQQEKRLSLLPKDRRCPVCGKIRLRSRQWVFKYGVMCLSCYRKEKTDEHSKTD